jgi:hypothetical protein
LFYRCLQQYLYVMGGRAREFVDLPEIRSVGGHMGPHVQDATPQPGKDTNLNPFVYSTQREASVYKNDVWKSLDGKTWTLVTPGMALCLHLTLPPPCCFSLWTFVWTWHRLPCSSAELD